MSSPDAGEVYHLEDTQRLIVVLTDQAYNRAHGRMLACPLSVTGDIAPTGSDPRRTPAATHTLEPLPGGYIAYAVGRHLPLSAAGQRIGTVERHALEAARERLRDGLRTT